MIITFDRSLHAPVYLQIADSIRKLIGQGVLRSGEKLPSTRELAARMGVNRLTVEAAFRRLEADGLICSHVGRGTFVTASPPRTATHRSEEVPTDPEALARAWTPLFVDLRQTPMSLPPGSIRQNGQEISFVHAAPPASLFPAMEFRRCLDYTLKRRMVEISTLGSSDGLPSLKEYLTGWLATNDINVSPGEVIVTTGCQQSMDLIRKILIARGDSLLLENPTYPGAVAALAPSSAERLEVPLGDDGIDTRVFSSLGERARCKLIYTVPNFHNPTGHTMPLETRRHLATLACQLRLPIVEDDVFGELRYEGSSLPSLKALCPAWVIYISSFSKMLTPALRLGWMVAPRPVAKQLSLVKQATDLQTNLLLQAAMEEFCRRGLLHGHMKRLRRIFRKRRDAMAGALQRRFPSYARWRVPEGGLSFWVVLPPDWNAEELLMAACGRGVQFLPGSAFYFRTPRPNSLRLSFASESEQRIEEGIRILGQIIESRRSRSVYANRTQREAYQPIV